jgi:hypothetical protein
MVKCAQFPMHGWLIQVVEAPTPVSALLHAGIVNLGGFLLIMLAPLMSQAAIANWLLLIVAGLTCVAAALITMTRVSIKVLLAWSTVAQMGLMLVECALGLYGLALLHLVAHSCYKAYSFLAAGSQVESYLLQQLARPQAPGRLAVPGLFLAFAALVILAEGVFEVPLAAGTGPWILFCLLPVILISERRSVLGASALPTMVAIAAGLGVAYAVQKSLFVTFAPTVTMATAAQTLWCILLVGMLLGAYWLLRQHGHSGSPGACTATSTPGSTWTSGPRASPWRSGPRSCRPTRRTAATPALIPSTRSTPHEPACPCQQHADQRDRTRCRAARRRTYRTDLAPGPADRRQSLVGDARRALPEVAARISLFGHANGALMPREWFRERWLNGISRAQLERCRREQPGRAGADRLAGRRATRCSTGATSATRSTAAATWRGR